MNDRIARRQARSHAVARGLENKRKLQQKSGHNFHVQFLKEDIAGAIGDRKRGQVLVISPYTLPVDAPDLFHMLAAESPRLQEFHSHCEIIASLGINQA